jgi:hypothetical protein
MQVGFNPIWIGKNLSQPTSSTALCCGWKFFLEPLPSGSNFPAGQTQFFSRGAHGSCYVTVAQYRTMHSLTQYYVGTTDVLKV